jgi:hypothetical protein
MFDFLKGLFGGGHNPMPVGGLGPNGPVAPPPMPMGGMNFAGMGYDPATGMKGPGAALNPGATAMPGAFNAFMGRPMGGPPGEVPQPTPGFAGVEPGTWGQSGMNPQKGMTPTASPGAFGAAMPPPEAQPRPRPRPMDGIFKTMQDQGRNDQAIDQQQRMMPLLAFLSQKQRTMG